MLCIILDNNLFCFTLMTIFILHLYINMTLLISCKFFYVELVKTHQENFFAGSKTNVYTSLLMFQIICIYVAKNQFFDSKLILSIDFVYYLSSYRHGLPSWFILHNRIQNSLNRLFLLHVEVCIGKNPLRTFFHEFKNNCLHFIVNVSNQVFLHHRKLIFRFEIKTVNKFRLGAVH